MCLSTPSKCLQLKKEDLNKKCSQNIHSAMAKKLNAFIQVYFQCQYGTYRLQSLRVYWDTKECLEKKNLDSITVKEPLKKQDGV